MDYYNAITSKQLKDMDYYEFFLFLVNYLINDSMSLKAEQFDDSFSLFKDAFLLARKHDLAHLVYYAAEKAELLPEAKNEKEKEFLKWAEGYKYNAIMRYLGYEFEAKHINSVFNKVQIDHIFLKGTELRILYPEPWLRTSSDIDVLIHRDELEKAIDALINEGYEKKSGVQYHDVLLKYGKVHLELHHNIMETVGSLDKILSKVWDYTEDYDKNQKKMEQSFFVFHQIAHTAYHFTHGGCGFRPFIDLWLLEREGYDHEKVKQLCEDAGIGGFYNRIQELIYTFFAGMPFTQDNKVIADYILRIGEYGQTDTADALKAGTTRKTERRIRYIFIPYKDLIVIYPKAKNKLFIPYYQMKRWIDRIFVQKKSKLAIKKLKSMKNYDAEIIEKMSNIRRIAGLENI